jgi:hypothetical protein
MSNRALPKRECRAALWRSAVLSLLSFLLLPGGVVADHGVQGGDNLSHDGDDGDLRFLPGGREAFVEAALRELSRPGAGPAISASR